MSAKVSKTKQNLRSRPVTHSGRLTYKKKMFRQEKKCWKLMLDWQTDRHQGQKHYTHSNYFVRGIMDI